MAKATKRKPGKTKKELLDEAVAQAVGAGRELYLETVDFSDPNRPKTCLEVDFPILPINHVAAIEGNAGKPIYQMSKWWARRRSSVFRAMLIAAATKAPDDPAEAAKVVWDAYYGNHQKNEGFRKLKVADIFMGGGTTIVEGARLGMQMYGNDLNPVAWFVVKNQLAQVDPGEVKRLLDHIEAEVKPQIMPFYACDCPRGHKGKWTRISTGKVMGESFDPLALTPDERTDYAYEGPEVIYTFWAKHGPCQATECDHRTPIMSSPVIAVKALTVKAWKDVECPKCGKAFDVEEQEARMAPAALFVVSPAESAYAIRDEAGNTKCPQCGHTLAKAMSGKPKNKSVDLALLIHPDWLKGSPGHAPDGTPYGGSVTDSAEATAAWNEERAKSLKLIEVRGPLPEQVICPDTSEKLCTDGRGGTVPRKATFACKEATCGREADVLRAITTSGRTAPVAAYAFQGYCPSCNREGLPYSGRFFAAATVVSPINAATREWENQRETAFAGFWSQSPIPSGLETSVRTPLQKYHYKFWSDFFNLRQMIVHTNLMRSILHAGKYCLPSRLVAFSVFQQYLRNQNMFCIWDIGYDKLAPFLSKNNLHPPNRPIENGVFSRLGRGNWGACADTVLEAVDWKSHPWEVVSATNLRGSHPHVADELGDAKSVKVLPLDSVLDRAVIECGSSTELNHLKSATFDLVITDPPFGDIMQYAELSGFFYSWLKQPIHQLFPTEFSSEQPPTALEVVENSQRHGKESSEFYNRLLTNCWTEANRILKPGGVLAFTFHHDKDGPWVAVLESLFNAGFYLECAFPIRSDETKGEGSKPGTFGAQKVEYDIIHVCRKRTEAPEPVSWARLRRQIMQDVRQLQEILEAHQSAGLQEADIQVIRRGKALEYYSKHYGKVYVEKGREFTVREALVGIKTLLDDEQDSKTEAPPVTAEPYTRQFLRLFLDRKSLEREQMQKYLRGTGVSPAEFLERDWCTESQKVFHITSPVELAKKWKGASRTGMGRDFDQAMFLIGACYENSGIRVQDTLDSPNFTPHPATSDLLGWFVRHGGDADIKNAARLAKQLYDGWVAKNEKKVVAQRTLFDLGEEEA